MHAQVMSNNNGSVAQVISVLDDDDDDDVFYKEMIRGMNQLSDRLLDSIKEKNKKLV